LWSGAGRLPASPPGARQRPAAPGLPGAAAADEPGDLRALPSRKAGVMAEVLPQRHPRHTGTPLRGAVVVLTGAAGQIGRALVDALETAGSTVVGLDLAAACPEGDRRYVPCDITDERAVRTTV